jgi:hypothetical protein
MSPVVARATEPAGQPLASARAHSPTTVRVRARDSPLTPGPALSAIITFDDSLWPLLILRGEGEPTDQQMKEYQAQSLSYLQRGEKYVTISDLSRLGMLSPTQRRMQADYLLRNADALGERLLGNAAIIRSAPLRLIIYLILPFQPTPMPFNIVADMDSAVTYVLRRLRESGLGDEATHIQQQLEQRASHLG